MGVKECASCDEQQMIHGFVESLYCTLETNKILYVKKKVTKKYLFNFRILVIDVAPVNLAMKNVKQHCYLSIILDS